MSLFVRLGVIVEINMHFCEMLYFLAKLSFNSTDNADYELQDSCSFANPEKKEACVTQF